MNESAPGDYKTMRTSQQLIIMASHQRTVKIALLFGGQSPEHNVSIQSARNLHSAITTAGYEILLIGIDRDGVWRLMQQVRSPTSCDQVVALLPGSQGNIINSDTGHRVDKVDVVFPMVHGPRGEDGSLQGIFKHANVPFVGSSITSSANCMDKYVCKKLLGEAGIKTTDYILCTRDSMPDLEFVKSRLGMPFMVKPANMGSSIGIQKVDTVDQFALAIHQALMYDTKCLLEQFVDALEIECAVLQRKDVTVSVPGAIRPSNDKVIYSYDLKYVNPESVTVDIPANISTELTALVQGVSLSAYQALECEGMARVDLFLADDNTVLVNEINTLPGFTSNSLYPKLWEASGVPQAQVIHDLIAHSLTRFDNESRLHTC